ncbi:MAG: terpene cyclase/mutase family protein [Anaerolineales bacterium]|nr:terpene cyclase/mutase family protein [Anaerolineales bacterium]
MQPWQKSLAHDPIPPLHAHGNEALRFFVRRDLLGEDAGPIQELWRLPDAAKILRKQQRDGSFPVPAARVKHPAVNYRLVETWRYFRILVEMYGFTREDPQAERAAEFLFSCQTADGDFRGFLADQYATYYTGAVLSLLVQAGYGSDPRAEKCFRWLRSMRQDDGGWTIPILTHPFNGKQMYRLTGSHMDVVEPDRTKPFSHNWTGMVLRAFAVHPKYRRTREAKAAASLLADRFFQPDVYTSYQSAEYWIRFEYPFWWNNLVAALDSVSRIGLPADDPRIAKALDWLVRHQERDGLWRVTYAKPHARVKETAKVRGARCWISLAVCRVLRRYYQ